MNASPLIAKQRVDQALELLRRHLDPYVRESLQNRFGEGWGRYVRGTAGREGADKLDIYALVKTILGNWQEVFRFDEALRKVRSHLSHVLDARNASSHFDGIMEDREALRYLDAIREVLSAIGAAEAAAAIEKLYDEQRRDGTADSADEGAREEEDEGKVEAGAAGTLPPWRKLVQPHRDVLSAQFSDAEFAANLAHVDQGLGAREYGDPRDFFEITYLTRGLRWVLRAAILRLAGKGGEPVVGLQTNFGGGKTHTMLALYHLAGAAEQGYPPETLPGLAEVFRSAEVDTLRPARRAVFVGTHKGPNEVMHAEAGRELRTPWGYIAWRLGGWDAVDLIRESEAAYTNPGSEKLVAILTRAAPCLVLLDEVVAFAKQLEGTRYEAFHAFMQSLTEAAAAVPGAMVVGSLPESYVEVGDERGVETLKRLEKIFGRTQSAWTPASDVETFEIVRRRLFEPLDEDNERAARKVVEAFRRFYRDNPSDFPPEVRERAYQELMTRTYPIHPEVLKRFSEAWGTLEKFQRTRGILKIMASVVYELWSREDPSPLITLARFPLGAEKVRTGILEPLPPAYGAILQSEVEGHRALPARLEAERPRIGQPKAATRAARAVFLGTAPHAGDKRGAMSETDIKLACAEPGDQISLFAEAMQLLSERSAYLYRDGERYWFGVRPTLNRVADDRARDIDEERADDAIIALLKEERSKGGFHRLHVVPRDPLAIEESRNLGLVVLPPTHPHSRDGGPSKAAELATDILQRCGSGQRRFRNTLVFVAADENKLADTRELARRWLAWRSILEDVDFRRNLTESQIEEAKRRRDETEAGLRSNLRQTWNQVLYPVRPPDPTNGTGPALGFVLESLSVTNRMPTRPIAEAVYDKLKREGHVIDKLGPQTLWRELESYWPRDADHVDIATVADWFASYVHFPRLRDGVVFQEALAELLSDLAGPLVYAEGFDSETGTYRGLRRSGAPDRLDQGLLVLRDRVPDEPPGPGGQDGGNGDGPGGKGENGGGEKPLPPRPASLKTRFYLALDLEPLTAASELARILKEILPELERPDGSRVGVTVEVSARAPSGFPEDVIDVVRDNLKALGVPLDRAGFEEE